MSININYFDYYLSIKLISIHLINYYFLINKTRNLMKRRDFIKVASAGVILPTSAFIEPSLKLNRNNPVILSTWSFGLPANEAARKYP